MEQWSSDYDGIEILNSLGELFRGRSVQYSVNFEHRGKLVLHKSLPHLSEELT